MALRLGCPSCLLPADLATNVRAVADRVDDVELVLFDVPGHGCNFPDAAEVAELARLAAAHDLTYTVHLPLDLHRDRVDALEQAARAIAATRSLAPFAWVAHLDGTVLLDHPTPTAVATWQVQAHDVLARVAGWTGAPERVCVENVERWDPAHFARVVERLPVSRCVDFGHLWLESGDPLAAWRAWGPRARVVHLHGVNGRDHVGLDQIAPHQLDPVVRELATGFSGVVTFEVFTEDELDRSLATWHDTVAQLGLGRAG